MKQRQRLDERRWRELVAEQAAGGQTVAAFCGGRGIATSTFFAKRRVLGTALTDDTADAAFVEVLAEEVDEHGPKRSGERPEPSAGSATLELVLACGVKVGGGKGDIPN